jgi:hypothetical protein
MRTCNCCWSSITRICSHRTCLLNGTDQGISEDYVAYRAQNGAKLIQYLGEFVAPEPVTTKAAN